MNRGASGNFYQDRHELSRPSRGQAPPNEHDRSDPLSMAHQADMPLPVSVQPTPLPVLAPAVVSPMSPAPAAIAYRSHSVEREEWPG